MLLKKWSNIMIEKKLKIRQASVDDAALIAEIGRRTFEETFGPDNTPEDMEMYLDESFSLDKVKAELSDPGSIFLLAYYNETLVGYAKLYEGNIPDCVKGERVVEFVRIYVIKETIGKGYGSELMSACLKKALDEGYRTAWLGVWERNESAVAFYEKWGFTKAGTQKFILGTDVQTDYVMVRSLD